MTAEGLDALLAAAVVDPTVHGLRPDYVALLVAAAGLPGGPTDEASDGSSGSESWWSEDRSVCNAIHYWAIPARIDPEADADRPVRPSPPCGDRAYG
jgi:hypothetical protein